jgi:hypothetical protein
MYKIHSNAICKSIDEGLMLAKLNDDPEVFILKSIEKEILNLIIDRSISRESLLKKAEEHNYEPQEFLNFSSKLLNKLEKLELIEKDR